MAHLAFTPNLQRHVSCPPVDVSARTVREALENVFSANPRLRGYIMDEHGRLRRHMLIFVDGTPIRDRMSQTDPVPENAEIFVVQALSGG